MTDELRWTRGELERLERQLREVAARAEEEATAAFAVLTDPPDADLEARTRATRTYWACRARAELGLRVADELARVRAARGGLAPSD